MDPNRVFSSSLGLDVTVALGGSAKHPDLHGPYCSMAPIAVWPTLQHGPWMPGKPRTLALARPLIILSSYLHLFLHCAQNILPPHDLAASPSTSSSSKLPSLFSCSYFLPINIWKSVCKLYLSVFFLRQCVT